MSKISQISICFVILVTALADSFGVLAQQPEAQDDRLNQAAKIDRQMRQFFFDGKYAEALPFAQQYVTIWEQIQCPKTKAVAVALLWSAQIEANLGRYPEAEKSYLRSLKIQVGLYGADHPEVLGCLSGLASVTYDQGKYTDAEMLYRKVIALSENLPTRDERNFAVSIDNLGVVLRELDKLDEAEAIHRRALPLMARAVGSTHPDYAAILNNLALIYQKQAKYLDALALSRQALAIKEQALSADHPDVATSLTDLASLHGDIHDFDEAKRLERRAMGIREKILPAGHPDIAKSYNNLAIYHFGANEFLEAEKLYRRALANYEKSLAGDHPYLATGLQNLATALQVQGKYAEAKELYDRALVIYKKTLGNEHPDVALCLHNESSVLASMGQWREAAIAIEQERRISRRHVARVLPSLNAKQQMFFLVLQDNDHRSSGLSLGLQQQESQELTNLSAGWLLNGKALAHEALAQNALLMRENNDPEIAAYAKNLLDVRRQLAGHVIGTGGGSEDLANRQQVEQLENRERELSEYISARMGRNLLRNPWVEVDEVRKSIPQDAVLVDIARFYEFDFETKVRAESWKSQRYVAWIIPPAGHGEIKIVDLGEAKLIDETITAVRKVMNEGQRLMAASAANREREESEAERAVRQPLTKLSQLVWKPISQKIDNETKQILLSPDGSLWLAPWCALAIENEKYLIEKYSVRYLVSGRDVVSKQTDDQSSTPPVIFADPNFDLGTSEVESATRAVLRSTQVAQNDAVRSLGPTTTRSALPRVARLKGTADEAQAISPLLAEYARRNPVAYLERYASEGIFKAIRNPQVLVLSTHGFFMPDQTSEHELSGSNTANSNAPRLPSWLRVDSGAFEHPLLRCGLLLAGCNQSKTSRDRQGAAEQANSSDDGILTGMEIIGVDLRGTELVVLSACETGLGEVQSGEGVVGLRQTFQLAGAKSVVATLWQIPDKESATMISEFFTNLAAGQPKAEALRNAQLELIKTSRKNHSAAHPYFWAAFTVTGD